MNAQLVRRNRIRELRQRAGLTQAALAKSAGLNPASLSRMESPLASPRLEHLRAIANALGVRVDDLIAA